MFSYLPLMSAVALICGKVQDRELQGLEFQSRLGTMFTIMSLSKTQSLNLGLVYTQEVVALSNMPEKLLTGGTFDHKTIVC